LQYIDEIAFSRASRILDFSRENGWPKTIKAVEKDKRGNMLQLRK